MKNTSVFKSAADEKEIMTMYDYVLERWPVPYESLNIPTRQGNTHMIASGKAGAAPLILLHGSCSNAVSWAGDIAEYSRHFRVYAVDIPGEAGKSAPNRPAWAGPGFAEWMEDILNALKIEKSSFLGLSLGGWMSVKFASSKPERVAKLALLAPGGIAQPKASFLFRTIMFSMSGKAGANSINRMVFGNQPMDEGAARFMNVIMTGFNPRFDRQPLFTDEELKKLTMPVLVIGGELDALLPSRKTIERMHRLLPQADTRLIPAAGHALLGMTSATIPFLL
jgi:pimeloyl-ACP methyl ester carboxylesterase